MEVWQQRLRWIEGGMKTKQKRKRKALSLPLLLFHKAPQLSEVG